MAIKKDKMKKEHGWWASGFKFQTVVQLKGKSKRVQNKQDMTLNSVPDEVQYSTKHQYFIIIECDSCRNPQWYYLKNKNNLKKETKAFL